MQLGRLFHLSILFSAYKSFAKSAGMTELFVKLPWQDSTLVMDPDAEHGTPRWEMITKRMTGSMESVQDIADAIDSYNQRFDRNDEPVFSNYEALRGVFRVMEEDEKHQFFRRGGFLEKIRNLVLAAPGLIPKPINWLPSGKAGTVELHQLQVACLLANAFFCTFPKRGRNEPAINFFRLYELPDHPRERDFRKIEKLRCILHYFKRVCEKQPTGKILFRRLHIPENEYPRWDKANFKLSDLEVESEGFIEDRIEDLQMDFANRTLGGGVLGTGLVQEEIRFIICPELIISRLFIEPMADNEAVIIQGTERYCNYTGYADTFQFTGDHVDPATVDDQGRRRTYVLAVDAIHFHRKQDQYKEGRILRELKKIYTGVKSISNRSTPRPLSTGNWGCGAYGGDPELKALIQLMAVSRANRKMVYFTFGDEDLQRRIIQIHTLLREQKVTVGQLYTILVRYMRDRKSDETVFKFVLRKLRMDRNRNNLHSFFKPGESSNLEGGQKRSYATATEGGKLPRRERDAAGPSSRPWNGTRGPPKTAESTKPTSSAKTREGFFDLNSGPISPGMIPDSDDDELLPGTPEKTDDSRSKTPFETLPFNVSLNSPVARFDRDSQDSEGQSGNGDIFETADPPMLDEKSWRNNSLFKFEAPKLSLDSRYPGLNRGALKSDRHSERNDILETADPPRDETVSKYFPPAPCNNDLFDSFDPPMSESICDYASPDTFNDPLTHNPPAEGPKQDADSSPEERSTDHGPRISTRKQRGKNMSLFSFRAQTLNRSRLSVQSSESEKEPDLGEKVDDMHGRSSNLFSEKEPEAMEIEKIGIAHNTSEPSDSEFVMNSSQEEYKTCSSGSESALKDDVNMSVSMDEQIDSDFDPDSSAFDIIDKQVRKAKSNVGDRKISAQSTPSGAKTKKLGQTKLDAFFPRK